MSATAVTTWSLEQTDAADLLRAAEPDPLAGFTVTRAELPGPAFGRFLYTAVGSDVSWTDRLEWPAERWSAHLDRPEVETWVGYERGTPAGYVELEAQPDGQVEIVYFGLVPAARGRRLGGHLLSFGTARAWDLADRLPGREATRRVWLHTCSLDGPHALANYRARGFRLFRTETAPAGG